MNNNENQTANKQTSGNVYQEGTYRLWMDESGALRMKLDKKKELYYIPKNSKLYNDLVKNVFDEQTK